MDIMLWLGNREDRWRNAECKVAWFVAKSQNLFFPSIFARICMDLDVSNKT